MQEPNKNPITSSITTGPTQQNLDKLLLLTTFFILTDCVTTLTFYITKTGTERNPVLRELLRINPFLVYPFLLSILIPLFMFRFSKTTQTSISLFIITLHLLASINNLETILFQKTLILNYLHKSTLHISNTQEIPFLIGISYIGVQTFYTAIKNRSSVLTTLKTGATQYGLYLAAYLLMNIIPIIWKLAT